MSEFSTLVVWDKVRSETAAGAVSRLREMETRHLDRSWELNFPQRRDVDHIRLRDGINNHQ